MNEFLKLYLTGKNQSAYRLIKIFIAFFGAACFTFLAAECLYVFYNPQISVTAEALGACSAAGAACFLASSAFLWGYSRKLVHRQSENEQNNRLKEAFENVCSRFRPIFILPVAIETVKAAGLMLFALLPILARGIFAAYVFPLWLIGGALLEIYADFALSLLNAKIAAELICADYGDVTALYTHRVNYMPVSPSETDGQTLFFKNDADRRTVKKMTYESSLWAFFTIFCTVCAIIMFMRPISEGLPTIYAFFTFCLMVSAGISVYVLSAVRYYLLRRGILKHNLSLLGDGEEDSARRTLQQLYADGRRKRTLAFTLIIMAGLLIGGLTGAFWRPLGDSSLWKSAATLIFFFFVLSGAAAMICWSVMFAAERKKAQPVEEKLQELLKQNNQ